MRWNRWQCPISNFLCKQMGLGDVVVEYWQNHNVGKRYPEYLWTYLKCSSISSPDSISLGVFWWHSQHIIVSEPILCKRVQVQEWVVWAFNHVLILRMGPCATWTPRQVVLVAWVYLSPSRIRVLLRPSTVQKIQLWCKWLVLVQVGPHHRLE